MYLTFWKRAIWQGVITTEAFSILVNFGRKLTKLHEPSLASKIFKNSEFKETIKRFRIQMLSNLNGYLIRKWLF